MDQWEAYDLLDQLLFVGQLDNLPREPAELAIYRQLSLLQWPECPMSNDVYTCDATGRITALNLTANVPVGALASLTVNTNFRFLEHFEMRNFFGLATGLQVVANQSLIISNSTFYDAVLPVGLAFILHTPGNLTLTDVRFPRYNAQAATFFQVTPRFCRFINVLFACPVPSFLLPCFVNGDPARIRTIDDVPCTPPYNGSIGALPYLRSKICEGTVCRPQCDPQPLFDTMPYYPCTTREYGSLSYFPATPGFATFEFMTGRIGEIESIDVLTISIVGVVRRVELFDVYTESWVTVFRDDVPVRRSNPTATEQSFFPQRTMTNRIRLHLEQWFNRTDTIQSIRVDQAPWPQPAQQLPRLPICPTLVVLGKRSMLDETIGDSFCVGRICQFACSNVANFTFDRAVASPRFLIVEGGRLWSGASLAAKTSEETHVYALPIESEASAVVNVSADFDLAGVRRVRLVGAPAAGQTLPVASEPTKRGLSGVFVKTRFRQTPSGATIVPDGTSAFGGKSSAPFVADGNASVAVVASQTFAYVNATLWRFADDAWSRVPTSLTRIIANQEERTAPPPRRKLVAIGDSLLGVVSADSKTHDGSIDPLLVNRLMLQTAIDVFDIVRNEWFENFIRHDIDRNISDVDVVRWGGNGTLFGVVDRASRLTTQIEWRPLPYRLVPCTNNTDCLSCLTNQANDEPCRWCGARCASRQSACFAMEPSHFNVSLCESETTIGETTSMLNSTNSSTILSTTTTLFTNESTTMTIALQSTTVSDASDPLIPLYAVIGVVGGLILIGGVGALIWRLRNPLPQARRRDAKAVEMKGPKQESAPQQPQPGTVYDSLEDAPPLQTGADDDDRYGAHLADKE